MKTKLLFLALLLITASSPYSAEKPNFLKLEQRVEEIQQYVPIFYEPLTLTILDVRYNRDQKTIAYVLQADVSQGDIDKATTHTFIAMMLLPMLGVDIASWAKLDYQISVHAINKEFAQEAYIKYNTPILKELIKTQERDKGTTYSVDYTNSLVMNLAQDYGIGNLSTESMLLEFDTNYRIRTKGLEYLKQLHNTNLTLVDQKQAISQYYSSKLGEIKAPSSLTEEDKQTVNKIIEKIRELKNNEFSSTKITALNNNSFVIKTTLTEEETDYLNKIEEDALSNAETYYKQLLGSSYPAMQSVTVEFYNPKEELITTIKLK